MRASDEDRGIAQPGSAPALGAGGLQFKSGCPDQSLQQLTNIKFFADCDEVCDRLIHCFLQSPCRSPA